MIIQIKYQDRILLINPWSIGSMREPFTQLYVHLVWSTWDRQPLITEDIRPHLYAAIAKKCRELKCEPLAIGGVNDHVHLLCCFPPAMPIAELVKEVKGSSSHLVTHILLPGSSFKWQGGYGAFTLRKSEVKQVQGYILNQAKHHAQYDYELFGEKGDEDQFNFENGCNIFLLGEE